MGNPQGEGGGEGFKEIEEKRSVSHFLLPTKSMFRKRFLEYLDF